jgi:hypothetical protein
MLATNYRTTRLMRTISVAQATVTQNVSHFPVKPKYGCDPPNMMVRSSDSVFIVENPWVGFVKIDDCSMERLWH